MFRGCVFAVRTQSSSSIAPTVLSAIEEHDGQALPPNAPLTLATHAKRMLPVNDLLHCPFLSSKIQGATACGVSVTSFQGLQRQILLDMLWCMGVDVQKEMRLNAVSHIIARDVDDKSSKKLEHARKPDWAATISIVNCKWIYDCIRQWKMLPSGAYMCNCSDAEANSWHADHSAVSGLDTQQMALQVAGAEAATAKLIAQMTVSSPERDDAAGHQPQQQQQHSSDRENVPRQQQQQYTGKRSNNVQMAAAEAVAQQQPRGEALEPEELVGRAVQQQFEEGLFKGIVKKYNKKHRWFLIEYEDGDRQDLTWKELQPIMLPDVLVRDPEAPSAHPAKPKRKLQKVNTHTRKGKRARRHSSQDDEEAVLADEPIRSNTPAGARANAGNSPWSTSKKKGKAVLALGSMHTRDQQVYFSKLTKIGVPCVTHKQCPGWKSSITHVVLPSLLRSVKSLAGMAGGCWILHADFVDACASAEALVEPDEFELEGGSELISAHAPRHWRERHAVQGVGAFHSLQVLMYGACDKPGPAREDIATIIQSGGGTVTKCEKPCNTLTKAIARGTHLAIMSTDRTAADPGVKQLLKARVPCASARFVVEWLAHPEQELSDYLLFDSEIEPDSQSSVQADRQSVRLRSWHLPTSASAAQTVSGFAK
ncbi:hypothetical protein WJX79_002272 [Trebouxia sp. C0005]